MADLPSDIEAFLARLDTPGARAGDGVELVLDSLADDRAELLCRAAMPHAFDPYLLIVLDPALGEEEALAAFEDFAALSLTAEGPDGMSLKDQPRAHLFGQWLDGRDGETFRAVNARLVEHFTHIAKQAAGDAAEAAAARAIFHRMPLDQDAAIVDFEVECRRERYAQRFADVEALISLMREYDRVLTPANAAIVAYHDAKLAADLDQRDLARRAFAAVRDDDEAPPAYRIKAEMRLGGLEGDDGNHAAAIERYEAGLDMLGRMRVRLEPPEALRRRILLELGVANRELKRFDEAQGYLDRVIALADDADDLHLAAVAYNARGLMYADWREAAKAIPDFEGSEARLLELGRRTRVYDRLRLAEVYNNLGTVYADATKWSESQANLTRSLRLKQAVEDARGEARVLTNLARAVRASDESEKALGMLRDAVDLFTDTRDTYGAAVATRNIGLVERSLGREPLARKELEQTRAMFERIGEEEQVAAVARDLSHKPGRARGCLWAGGIVVGLFVVLMLLALLAAAA